MNYAADKRREADREFHAMQHSSPVYLVAARCSAPTVRRRLRVEPAILAVAIGAAGCLQTSAVAQRAGADARTSPAASPFVIRDTSDLDPKVPTPESLLGHAIGERPVRYEPMVRYLKALADASPFAKLTESAETHEGRKLYYLTITSEANHARLDRIRADNAKLADPRKLVSPEEGDRIAESLPGVAWLAYSIHGDELSSTDAALQVAYWLVAGADEGTRRLRDELVVHLDPLMNPDGRERYLGQLEHLQGKIPNTDFQGMQHGGLWSAGRGNHYLFDLNRDWLAQVHPETRGRSAAILSWNPHLLVDSHEMGGLDTYLFDPPREPFNINLGPKNLEWRRKFSADQASALDRYGWSYYTQDWYEEWYPGYTNAWANLLGAIGMLYEQAGVDADGVRQASGKILSYSEAVQHHVVSSFANLESLRKNRKDILRDALADRRWLVDATRSGGEVFLIPPPADRDRWDRLGELLTRHGIEYVFATQPFTAATVVDIWGRQDAQRSFPSGTMLIRAAQPHRRLLRAILEFDPHMSDAFLIEERTELENRRDTRLYDVTAWNLCMAYGVNASLAASIEPVATQATWPRPTPGQVRAAGYGYLVDGSNANVMRAVARLLENDCKVRVADKPFKIGGQNYLAGAALLRKHENDETLTDRLREATTDLGVDVRAVDSALCESGPDLGSPHFRLLSPPRVALASQWPLSSTSFGAMWHLLDGELRMRVSPVNIQAIGFMDLRRYNVLILPDTWGADLLAAALPDAIRKSLRNWVSAGGTLIAVGNSAAFLAGKENGLSAVRLRQDVLDKLPAYEAAVQRERDARRVTLDRSKVWANGAARAPSAGDSQASPSQSKVGEAAPATTETGERKPANDPGTPTTNGASERSVATTTASDSLPAAAKGGARSEKGDLEAMQREDAWRRQFSPTGVFLAADIASDHWLTFGASGNAAAAAEDRLPVFYSGSHVFVSEHPVATPVRLAPAGALRLSGLLWPEARERLGDAAYATVERVGDGQIILFATDPAFRGFMEGTERLLLNAVILGPGLGTRQPLPW